MRVVSGTPDGSTLQPYGGLSSAWMPAASRLCQIVAAQLRERRTLAQQHARPLALMLAEQPGLARVEAAEVEEPERHTVDEIAVAVAEHLAAVQIPVGDVVAGILEDVVIEERRHEVHPPLIGEHHLRDVDQRLAPRRLPPPVEKRPRRARRPRRSRGCRRRRRARRSRRSRARPSGTGRVVCGVSTMPCAAARSATGWSES